MDSEDFDDLYDELNRVFDDYDSDMEVLGTEGSFGTDDAVVDFDSEF